MSGQRSPYGLGVTRDKKRTGKPFRARFFCHGKVDLGRFETAQEACLAYDQAALSVKPGEGICKATNFPSGTHARYSTEVDDKVRRHLTGVGMFSIYSGPPAHDTVQPGYCQMDMPLPSTATFVDQGAGAMWLPGSGVPAAAAYPEFSSAVPEQAAYGYAAAAANNVGVPAWNLADMQQQIDTAAAEALFAAQLHDGWAAEPPGLPCNFDAEMAAAGLAEGSGSMQQQLSAIEDLLGDDLSLGITDFEPLLHAPLADSNLATAAAAAAAAAAALGFDAMGVQAQQQQQAQYQYQQQQQGQLSLNFSTSGAPPAAADVAAAVGASSSETAVQQQQQWQQQQAQLLATTATSGAPAAASVGPCSSAGVQQQQGLMSESSMDSTAPLFSTGVGALPAAPLQQQQQQDQQVLPSCSAGDCTPGIGAESLTQAAASLSAAATGAGAGACPHAQEAAAAAAAAAPAVNRQQPQASNVPCLPSTGDVVKFIDLCVSHLTQLYIPLAALKQQHAGSITVNWAIDVRSRIGSDDTISSSSSSDKGAAETGAEAAVLHVCTTLTSVGARGGAVPFERGFLLAVVERLMQVLLDLRDKCAVPGVAQLPSCSITQPWKLQLHGAASTGTPVDQAVMQLVAWL